MGSAMTWARTLRSFRWLAAVAAVLIVALPTAALVAPAGPPAPPGSASGLGAPTVLLAPAFVPGPGVLPLGPLPASEPLAVVVALAQRDPEGLANAIALAYTPGSPEFHHFLSPEEVAEEYGPPASSYEAAAEYFEARGLSVQASPDRTLLLVQGPASLVAAAFATTFERYERGTGWFYSHPAPAELPNGIGWAGAVGLGNESTIEPAATPNATGANGPAPAAPNCQPSSWGVSPCEARYAYNLSGFVRDGVNGTGYRVGIVDTYDGAESQTALASDFAQFDSVYDLPYGNVSWVYPVATSTDLNKTFDIWGTEEALDLEWTRAMAPGASIDMTFAPDSTYGLYEAVDYLVAHHSVDVLTMSWGENDVGIYNADSGPCPFQCNASSDGSYGILHPVLEAAAAEGISVFSSSGDCGAAAGTSGVSTNYPASDPYVTGVGGTDLVLNSSGGWAGERGWWGNSSGATTGCANQGGSSGGWSPFDRPYWQTGPNLTRGPDLRGVPDVAALAGSPGVPIVLGGNNGSSGGTSVSSPMWAGIAAIADQEAGGPLGFLNPSLYEVARSGAYHSAFHDITAGWNGYWAGPGWDPVTGLGSPNGAVLLPLLSAGSPAEPKITVNLTASPRFGALPLSVTFRANASGGQRPYSFYDITFGDGNSTTTTDGVASHTYESPGVFAADAVVFDHASNSSVSVPVAIVVGGGTSLNVSLNATPQRPSAGANVTFGASVSGGRGPYQLHYSFGDGTYLDTDRLAVVHAYAQAGGYCTAVVVGDARTPPDGAASPSVGVGVGGAAAPNCTSTSRLRATLTLSEDAADAPGDIAFATNVSGGTPPYDVRYSAGSPYVAACQCGIFPNPGAETVTVLASDSTDLEASASQPLTVYPRLLAHLAVNRSAGPAPLSVVFNDSAVVGGHGSAPSIEAATHWSFGDGGNATGDSVTHVYAHAGWYVAIGSAADGAGGVSSEAFLIEAYPSGPPPSTVVAANITPAVDVPAGTLVNLSAHVSGTAGPYLVRWDLGANDSAFGPYVEQSYAYAPCLASGLCALLLGVAVENHSGGWTNLSIPIGPSERGNASALVLSDRVGASTGTTPFLWQASATATGMPNASIAWTFGDGTNATGTVANHTYLAPGNYTVTEVATDPFGDHLVRTHTVVVVGVPRTPPTVVGGPNVTSGLAPLSVGFAARASGGAGGPYTYDWAFGDGWRGSGNATDHVYATPGVFEANVTAVDAIGSPASATYTITVYNTTSVGFAVANWSGTAVTAAPLRVAVVVSPVCRSDSRPGCAASAVTFRAAILSASAPAPGASSTEGVAGQAGPTGWANVTLRAPGTTGSYVLYVWAAEAGYVGTSGVLLRVVAAIDQGPPAPGLADMEVGAIIVVAAAAVVVTLLVLRRRRSRPPPATPARPATPSRPRGGAGGRRAG
jgi:kumamolisin